MPLRENSLFVNIFDCKVFYIIAYLPNFLEADNGPDTRNTNNGPMNNKDLLSPIRGRAEVEQWTEGQFAEKNKIRCQR